MAHLFSNFDDAYNALRSGFTSGIAKFWDATDSWFDIQAHWQAGEDHAAIYDIMIWMTFMKGCINDVWNFSWNNPDKSRTLESIYWAHTDIDIPELNMASIIIAMYGATPSEFKDFIGIEDAYRQALWNMPFNREYYAELARGFAEWE